MTEEPRARKPRRDALENRERIVAYAEQVFVEQQSIDVSLHRIADGLGVGIGTVYRHFPTLDDLHFALHRKVVQVTAERIAEVARIPDPWDRIVGYVDAVLDLLREYPMSRLIHGRITRTRPDLEQDVPSHPELSNAAAEAKALGQLRDDVETTDLAVLPYLLQEVLYGDELTAVLFARLRILMLDALRPPGFPHTPLPGLALPEHVLELLAARAGEGTDPR